MNRKSKDDRARLLKCLLRSSTQRALTEEPFGVSIKTVAKLLRDTGQWACWFLDNLEPVDARWIQADEMWSYVGAKRKNVAKMKNRRPGVGEVWTYAAICADTKLIIAYHLGDRRVNSATKFFRKLDARLKRKASGEFNVRPLIVTDGLDAYTEAGAVVFGEDADRAMMIKKYSDVDPRTGAPTPRSRYQGAERVQLTRTKRIPRRKIHTSYVERVFGTLRNDTMRCTRQSLGFSKSRAYHEWHLALWIVYYNFCKTPRPKDFVDAETGEVARVKQVPPAVAAGLSDRVWDIYDLIEQCDAFHARSDRTAPETALETDRSEPSLIPSDSAFWVYHSPIHYKASVHTAQCSSCRNGGGQAHKPGRVGRWYPCQTREDALALARELEPDRFRECNLCLGEYNIRGRFGRSR